MFVPSVFKKLYIKSIMKINAIIKEEGEELKFTLILPSFSSIVFSAEFLLILSSWIIMLTKLQIWKEILTKLEELFFMKE